MSEVCQICNKQLARYTCPTCNAPYCSLACFRNPSHAQCSERFYHQSLVSDIQSSKETSRHDKAALFDMVKRLEDIDEPRAADTEEHQELAEKLQGLDIDALDVEGLEQLLTPDQLARFQQLVDSGNVDALLAEEAHQEPWWCAGPQQVHQDLASYLDTCPQLPVWKPENSGESLVYNLVTVALAYVYLYRSFPDFEPTTVIDGIQNIAPFLSDRTSTLVVKSTSEAVLYVFTRAGLVSDKKGSAALLEDLIKLLQPQPVAPIEEIADQTAARLAAHHNAKLLGALCHMHASIGQSARSKTTMLVQHKLKFYMALGTSQAPAVALPQMVQICNRLKRLQEDYQADPDPQTDNLRLLVGHDERRPVNETIATPSHTKSKIIELDMAET